ncbi:hypothetical protein O9G_000880 [Rozella allomycis CSF55]|uniref:Uncharacterized protein n=1 Tax=Rozella allomycis (strain CSF55) TaxID=988480 RepID=A0A075ARK0_ROZAC|nr:hypothetical protein O9G_000880 [Rozella allomycis CSF55]|eukprot:EPZ32805.1 hypothetical protein O9G_000880 [Rozella allomycis CSF55]
MVPRKGISFATLIIFVISKCFKIDPFEATNELPRYTPGSISTRLVLIAEYGLGIRVVKAGNVDKFMSSFRLTDFLGTIQNVADT